MCGFDFVETASAALTLSETIHHHFQKSFAACNVSLDGNLLATTVNQHFLYSCRHFKIAFNFQCQTSDIIVCLHIKKHSLCLANRLC